MRYGAMIAETWNTARTRTPVPLPEGFKHYFVANRGAHDSPSPSAGFGLRMRARYVVRGRVPSSLSIA